MPEAGVFLTLTSDYVVEKGPAILTEEKPSALTLVITDALKEFDIYPVLCASSLRGPASGLDALTH